MPRLVQGGLPQRIIHTVEQSGPVTGRQLAHHFGLTPKTVNRALHRLASRNLIRQANGQWETTYTPPPATKPVSLTWYDLRACINADPTLFYNSDHLAEALTYCAACPVTIQCANLRAETERRFNSPAPGIWGGQLWVIASVGKNGYRAKKAAA
jgi:hypothetical protein